MVRGSNVIYDRINLLETKRFLNTVYEFSSYLAGNTLRLRYKYKSVNAV
jgi:hypothetical protein